MFRFRAGGVQVKSRKVLKFRAGKCSGLEQESVWV